jgi:hypothetical protein
MSVHDLLRKYLTKSAVDVAQSVGGIEYPGEVITADLSAGWVWVGRSNIVKIHTSADIYVAYSVESTDPSIVSSTTSPAVLLKGSVEPHHVLSQSDYIRASANPQRVELLRV